MLLNHVQRKQPSEIGSGNTQNHWVVIKLNLPIDVASPAELAAEKLTVVLVCGGADGARTRDLWRDRPVF